MPPDAALEVNPIFSFLISLSHGETKTHQNTGFLSYVTTTAIYKAASLFVVEEVAEVFVRMRLVSFI